MKSTSRPATASSLRSGCFPPAWGRRAETGQLTAVPYTAVEFHDTFWTPSIASQSRQVDSTHLPMLRANGTHRQLRQGRKLIGGNHEGTCANDSDVFKLIEGASYALATDRDPSLERMVDARRLPKLPPRNGRMDTSTRYYTLAEPGKRWTDLKDKHELYCAGHLFKAAVAHWPYHRQTHASWTWPRGMPTVSTTHLFRRSDSAFAATKRSNWPW